MKSWYCFLFPLFPNNNRLKSEARLVNLIQPFMDTLLEMSLGLACKIADLVMAICIASLSWYVDVWRQLQTNRNICSWNIKIKSIDIFQTIRVIIAFSRSPRENYLQELFSRLQTRWYRTSLEQNAIIRERWENYKFFSFRKTFHGHIFVASFLWRPRLRRRDSII